MGVPYPPLLCWRRYIPRHWYHQVKSPGPRNLAVNVWFSPLHEFSADDCQARKGQPPATLLQQNWFDEESVDTSKASLFKEPNGMVFREAMAVVAAAGRRGSGATLSELIDLIMKVGPQAGKVLPSHVEWIFNLLDREKDGEVWQDELAFGHFVTIDGGADPDGAWKEAQLRDWDRAIEALLRIGSASNREIAREATPVG